MATMWRKAMLYLGLGPDEEYDDYDPGYDDAAPRPAPGRQAPAPPPAVGYDDRDRERDVGEPSAIGTVRPMGPSRPDPGPPAGDFATQVGSGTGVVARPRPKVVRPMPVASTARPRLVVPLTFNQAQELADTFKGGQPVVMNLRHAEREVSRRLIDFCSGLCYGLGGRMEKLDSQVYLLCPSTVEVSAEERDRLRDRGYED
ncbi:MAG TPA: cell division protein SepF [Acidimicrobiales bacterium]|nr:cell division protein SepF [Acidimicrobiales bacterium]